MSVLEKLKSMVKEAQEDIEKSQEKLEKERLEKSKTSKQPTQTSSEKNVENIQKYRKSALETKEEKPKKTKKEAKAKIQEKSTKTKEKLAKEKSKAKIELEKQESKIKTELEEEKSKAKEKLEKIETKIESKKQEKQKTKSKDKIKKENSEENTVKIEETKTEKVKNESIKTETEKNTENSEEKQKTEISEKKDKKSDKMSLLNDNDIFTMDDIDVEFHQKFIDAGVETVDHCFQCGTCGGSCPSGRRTPYRVRKLVRNCLLGLKDEVITDDALWMCTTCYTCQERCPRGVKIVDVVKQARRIASHAGYMAKAHKMTGVFVINTGHGVPINDATKELRTKIGLPELPPTTHSFPEALKEVQEICKACEFDELIGYDEATGGLKE